MDGKCHSEQRLPRVVENLTDLIGRTSSFASYVYHRDRAEVMSDQTLSLARHALA
jgi:hypothetical protein